MARRPKPGLPACCWIKKDMPMAARTGEITRTTKETDIALSLAVDGRGAVSVTTGVGFFDHMLTLLGRHALFDLSVTVKGDLHVDAHHTVEDVGIALGSALVKALGDKRGIVRYGHAVVPMDETRVEAALDLSGRAYLLYQLDPKAEKCGDFDTCLGLDFFQGFANAAGMNLHIVQHAGTSPHHILEAAFKAVARALRTAVSLDGREQGIPSSKGVL